jgi:hypothetical protein
VAGAGGEIAVGSIVTIDRGHNSVKGKTGTVVAITGSKAVVKMNSGARQIDAPLASLSLFSQTATPLGEHRPGSIAAVTDAQRKYVPPPTADDEPAASTATPAPTAKAGKKATKQNIQRVLDKLGAVTSKSVGPSYTHNGQMLPNATVTAGVQIGQLYELDPETRDYGVLGYSLSIRTSGNLHRIADDDMRKAAGDRQDAYVAAQIAKIKQAMIDAGFAVTMVNGGKTIEVRTKR